MSKKSQIFFILILFFPVILFLYLNNHKDLRVAHAGGLYDGKINTNSIASIENNIKFTKYFELDLQLTKDKRLVCYHHPKVDNKYFDEIKDEIIINNYCYDESLKEFLKKNKEIFIITDFKTNNLEGLKFIKNYFNSNMNRFIPQIYYEKEYLSVKELGYKKIIFTFYRMAKYSNEQISKIVKKMELFAITVNPARLRSGLVKVIDEKNFFIYVHTVNSLFRFIQYKLFFGANEIYTDNLF